MSDSHPVRTNHPDETRDEVARLIAEGLSIPKAAEAAGVPRRTAYDWSRTPEFQLRIAAHREGLETLGSLSNAALAAKLPAFTDALVAMVESPDTPPEVRLKAIQWAHERFAPQRAPETPQGPGASPVQVLFANAVSAPPELREAKMLEAKQTMSRLALEAYGLSAPVEAEAGEEGDR